MNSFEQLRSIFDKGTAGLILIGMPGIEKRIARFPQFYSRIGFVHEFRPLDSTEMHELLERRWVPVGVTLPDEPLLPGGHREADPDDRRQLSTVDPSADSNRAGARGQSASQRLN
jgi:hypothetical protein